jgi:molecular chaperone DnaK (HSP70)
MEADNERLVAYVVAMFEAANGVDLRSDDVAMKRVREAAARACVEWKGMPNAGLAVNLPFISANPPLHVLEELGVGEARRLFAGEDYSDKLTAARAERERATAAQRLQQETDERVHASEERAQRSRTTKITLVVVLLVFGLGISFVAALRSCAEHGDHVDDSKRSEHR